MLEPHLLGGAPTALWPDPLQISMSADGRHVRLFRHHLLAWLTGGPVDVDVAADLVMATSEALENCCDHAFAGASSTGTMTLTARSLEGRMVVTVTDDGHWQQDDTGPGHRGRGLTMMRTLVDEVDVVSGPEGSQLTLTLYEKR